MSYEKGLHGIPFDSNGGAPPIGGTQVYTTVNGASYKQDKPTASGTDVYTFLKAGSTIYGSVVQAMA